MTRTLGRRFVVMAVAVGLSVLALGFWWMNRSTATPDIVEGWASPNSTGSAISFRETPDASQGEGYIISGARWSGPDDVLHEGADLPTCVGTDTTASTHVQLGLIDVDAEQGSWTQVVWLRCLE